MYHPAVALYNPTLKTTLEQDFKKLEIFLEGKSSLLKYENLEEQENVLSNEKRDLVDDLLKL
jgi:hypothetical protein